jgi:hypothetical protein
MSCIIYQPDFAKLSETLKEVHARTKEVNDDTDNLAIGQAAKDAFGAADLPNVNVIEKLDADYICRLSKIRFCGWRVICITDEDEKQMTRVAQHIKQLFWAPEICPRIVLGIAQTQSARLARSVFTSVIADSLLTVIFVLCFCSTLPVDKSESKDKGQE